MTSLQTRVTLVAALVLLVFVVLTSLALERAFQAAARSAREERLLGQVYLLMAAADAQEDGLTLPPGLAEARLSLPGSGLYGQVSDTAGTPIWRSPSALGQTVPFGTGLAPGQRRFREAQDDTGRAYFVEDYGVTWTIGPVPRGYTFSVAEDLTDYALELDRFRTSLARWLGAMAALLLVALLAALRWGLAPLRRAADEVAAVEAGTQDRLHGRYPRELRPLTDNLNALLAHESARQTRLGHALADLAHSLKTPLAVLRGALAQARTPGPGAAPSGAGPWSEQAAEQVRRMEEIVAYQLERARPRPVATLAPPVPVAQAVERLRASLAKLHAGRAVQVTLDLEPGLSFRGVEGDLLEVLGNLLDNAYKWCRTRVGVGGRRAGTYLVLWVEDDGPGIPAARAREVLGRGARADLATPGHGIGLAVVTEICRAYGGDLEIVASPLGGALIRVRLPA
ncbi:ATP-binding protein [Candidatus Thiodictyon syntrophicum]|uniref:histidine kinase n=1 Tax=Candidatus Thiodictyon syntrophicum TaxID=1166950 RepID=A0A2K8UBM2_9GAMM|nr:ATP-binding protein [Candidatus Thiodictyon syntrophicum]AUB82983.1 two-component sensor histidine kinase [Candidatus Thiodictyon syntrophicum]